MSRPKILHLGGTLYWVIRTRNPDTMVLKDADSTPTVAVRKNGASTADSVTVTKRSATTGIYDCSYNPAGEAEGDEFTIEESATVTGTTTSSATYENSWDCTVIAVERGTDSAALATQATAIETDTQDIQSRIPAALVGGRIDANMGAISSDSIAADNAEAFFDGTGYAGTGNTIPSVTTVGSVSGAVGSVTGNVGGNVVGSVGSVTGAVGSVTAAVTVGTNNDKTGYGLATGAITAAVIATDAIDADAIAASAVTEIQSGLATAAGVSAVETDTQDIQARLPAALVSGRMDSSVGAMAANTVTASALASDAAGEIADAVWDEATVDHTSTGSFGSTVTAINSKTTNLPTDPADASDIAAAFVTVNSKLDAIDDYVDTEVAAIKAVTDKMDGMLVLDGSVYQYTTNALENGPSGSSSVYVYPLAIGQEQRNTHQEITVYTSETGSQYFFAVDSDNTAIDLTGLSLEFRVGDNKTKAILYTASTADATLTVTLTNKVTFTKSTKFTRFANSDVSYSLRNMDAGGEVLLDGPIRLKWAPVV